MSHSSCAKCGATKVGESDLCHSHGGENESELFEMCKRNIRTHVKLTYGIDMEEKAMSIIYEMDKVVKDATVEICRLENLNKDLLEAAKLSLAMIKNHFPLEHGMEDVGLAWGACEKAIALRKTKP